MLEEYFEDICWCFETNSLFFAKIIRIISTKLKTRPRKIATIVVLLSCFLLTNPSTANSVSNIILFVPVFTISLFPSQNTIEFDSNDIFLYWSLYSIISIFDPLFQKSTPLYYLLKVFAISTIYLRPFQFRNILKKSVLRKIDIIGDVTERHFNRIIDKCVNITQSDQMLTAICKCDSITSKLSK
uniref:Odorant receptor n=1 Tax=Strongyloides venezuelensis TaxID=75913 RepID=A0A0K0FWK9_STRVS